MQYHGIFLSIQNKAIQLTQMNIRGVLIVYRCDENSIEFISVPRFVQRTQEQHNKSFNFYLQFALSIERKILLTKELCYLS